QTLSNNLYAFSLIRCLSADFGYSAHLSPEEAKRNSQVGTTYWMVCSKLNQSISHYLFFFKKKAPEVITTEMYDTKVDIWSTGIMAIELIEGEPPYMDLPPIKALLMITTQGRPEFKNPGKQSPELVDFVNKCTQMKPEN